jgi:hypothetical protein
MSSPVSRWFRHARLAWWLPVASLSVAALAPRGGGAQRAALAAGPGPRAAAPRGADVRRSLSAAQTTERILVDGRLDERAWRDAPAATDFVQQRPSPGRPASQRSEARVIYDGDALYVAMRLYDAHGDSVTAALGRRDYDAVSDWAHVLIDSYFDRRTAFRFAINPAGVKQDAMLSGDAEWNEDRGWNAVWDGAAARDSLGWAAEFRIPLTQLRFRPQGAGAEAPRWGVQFIRDVARLSERAVWAPIPPDANGFVSLFGELGGLRGIAAPRRLEVVPYAVGSVTRAPVEPGDPLHSASTSAGSFGADVQYGLTSDLTLTATLHPDFGQVEADPSLVNLTGAEAFLVEQRPFFVEGSDIFRTPLAGSPWAFGEQHLFYSRRIGRAPQLGVPDDATYEDVPPATTLLGAMKLSGKTAGGWSVGLLDAVTAEERATYIDGRGARTVMTAEPLTNYAMARAIRDFRAGTSAVGGAVTATTRRLDDGTARRLRGGAYVGGVDGRHRWGGNDYLAEGSLRGSYVTGSAAAIARTQRGAVHYFQRPDAPHLEYDTTRTSLAGLTADVRVRKMGGGAWRWGVVSSAMTPGFEANDLGFHQSADALSSAGWVGYEGFKPGRRVRGWALYHNAWSQWSTGGERRFSAGNLFGRLDLQSNWQLFGDVRRVVGGLDTRALRGGPALARPGNVGAWLNVVSDARRVVSGALEVDIVREDEGPGRSLWVSPAVTVRPSSGTELALGPSLTRTIGPSQFVDAPTEGPETRHVVGELHQTTAALTLRASYTFTPDLTVQLYAQPFLSAGSFRGLKEVRAPRATRLADRFRRFTSDELHLVDDGARYEVDRDGDGTAELAFDDPDFNVRELQSNAVLRWEYRPGSAVFVVWTQGRDADDDGRPFELGRDARQLLGTRPTNTLLVKFSHWLRL